MLLQENNLVTAWHLKNFSLFILLLFILYLPFLCISCMRSFGSNILLLLCENGRSIGVCPFHPPCPQRCTSELSTEWMEWSDLLQCASNAKHTSLRSSQQWHETLWYKAAVLHRRQMPLINRLLCVCVSASSL